MLVGQPHQQGAAHAGLQVLRRDAGELDRRLVGVDHRRDRHDGVVQAQPRAPGPRRRRASARWTTSTAARRRARGRRPGRRRRSRRPAAESMPPERPSTTEGMPFLSMKSRRPRTSARQTSSQSVSGSATVAGPRLERRHRLLGEHVPGDGHRADPAVGALGHRRRVDRQVDGQQVLDELRRAGQQLAVGGDDQRVAVEDQLVLAADLVAVEDRAPAPRRRGGGPAAAAGRPWPARRARRWGRRRGRRRPARRRRTARPRPRGPRRWSARCRRRAAGRSAARCRARSSGPRRRRRSWAGAACSSGRRPRRRTAARRRCAGRRGGGWRRRGGRRRSVDGRPAPGRCPRCARGTRRRRRPRPSPSLGQVRPRGRRAACSLACAKDSRSTRSSAG